MKIFVNAYLENNLGDDLFFKIIYGPIQSLNYNKIDIQIKNIIYCLVHIKQQIKMFILYQMK